MTSAPLLAVSLSLCFAIACGRSHSVADSDSGPDAASVDASLDRDGAAALEECWVVDTSGWGVRTPIEDGQCRFPGFDVPPDTHPVECPPGHVPFGAWSIDGRVVRLAATCKDDMGWSGYAGFWRPIACESDADCARIEQAEHPAICRAGTCQSVELPLSVSDVLALCLASTPREPRTWTVVGSDPALSRAYELAETYCPDPPAECEVPPECHPIE